MSEQPPEYKAPDTIPLEGLAKPNPNEPFVHYTDEDFTGGEEVMKVGSIALLAVNIAATVTSIMDGMNPIFVGASFVVIDGVVLLFWKLGNRLKP